MNGQILSAILLILGFVCVLAASFIGPPKLYQEPSIDQQLQLIADHTRAWAASNALFALGGLVTAAGLVLFSAQQWQDGSKLLLAIGAVAYLIGAAGYAFFLYQRTVDPASLFGDYSFSPLTAVLLGSLVIGLLLYGVAFWQAGYPAWLSIVTIAGMVLIGVAALFSPAQFFKFFPPQALFLFTFVAGIVMWRQ